ncbi:MAG: BlaI/MecI/CopY family transcriptional regulator [Prevotella sp.]|uniref:BlaI/MecI/CopY family transcriptional regulator n=1 Tax=Prevotella sp. TaxID=59823 RepID=UPI002A34936C|nr:BlaI/MecI/CopY family transcriptional regulator [Prevotella sp.]MDD7319135.1 BlaI/MecI/CopY family transcriptional regulator [Prevotellaceae bacterium]MDY4019590.1 BlaI/MecI/CopY family transcriptional regulator [Prevotella sp.]
MRTLTNKEEEIMNHLWEKGSMKISELQTLYDEPKPHVNTLSTLVKILEEKGFVAHRALTARSYVYFAKITKAEYSKNSLTNVVDKFFGKNYINVVNTLVKDDKVSLEELKEIIRMVENE